MSSSLLSIARTALTLHQRAIDVVGQNLSNATVEGYSRQRVETAAAHPVYFANIGHVGTGVVISGIERARDALLDGTYRTQRGEAAAAGFSLDVLQQLEAIVGEPSSAGLAESLDAFWNAWSDLASSPMNAGARAIVQQRGAQLAATLNRFAAQVDQVDQTTREQLGTMVSDANQLTRQIADLNRMIVAGEASGDRANDLRDARDRAIDQLATLGSVETIERGDGSVAVFLGGISVVDGTDAKALTTELIGGSLQVSFVAQPGKPLSALGGQIGAALRAINSDVPATMRELDALAATLVDTVNGIHQGGVIWNDATPPVASPAPEFFRTDPLAGSPGADRYRTARHITLSVEVAESASNIAASTATAAGPTNNAVALQLAALRDTPVGVSDPDGTARGTMSFGAFWRNVATDLGVRVRATDNEVAVRETLAGNADMRRQSVSGVSTDEELVLLIKHQQAYAAAARLVTVADEMSRILVELGR